MELPHKSFLKIYFLNGRTDKPSYQSLLQIICFRIYKVNPERRMYGYAESMSFSHRDIK